MIDDNLLLADLPSMRAKWDPFFPPRLQSLIECESPSSDREALRRSAALIAEIGTEVLKQSPETLIVDGRTNLRWRFGAAGRGVLLLCHHDTVWPLGTLAEHPFHITDGSAYGPGAFDMKSGLLQAFAAVANLRDRDGVTLLVTSDEEIGSPSSRALIEEEARRADAALVFEASGPGGSLKTRRKGPARYQVAITGRAAHAGLEPWKGVNATVEAAHQILAIARLSGKGETESTVTPTLLASGTAVNTVPASALLGVDVRSVSAADAERIDRALRALSPVLPSAEVEVTRETYSPPLEEAATRELFALARDSAADLGMPALTGIAVGGGSDGNIAAGVGCHVLDGLGAVGDGAHRPGEHVIVSTMSERALLASLIMSRILAGAVAPSPGIGL